VLYSGNILWGEKFKRLMTLQEICEAHKWRCPNCGRALKSSEAKIEVSPADESL